MSKKILSLLLAVAMAMSLSSMALAGDFSEDFGIAPDQNGVVKVTREKFCLYASSLDFGEGYSSSITFDTTEMKNSQLFALSMAVRNSGEKSLKEVPQGKEPKDYDGLYRTEVLTNFHRSADGSKIVWDFAAGSLESPYEFPVGELTVSFKYYEKSGNLACDVNVKAKDFNQTVTIENFGPTADSTEVKGTTYNYKNNGVSGQVPIDTVGGPRYLWIFPAEGHEEEDLNLIVKSYTSPLEGRDNDDSDDNAKSEEQIRQEAAVSEVNNEISNTLNVVAQAAAGGEAAKADLAKLPTATVTVGGAEVKAPVVTFDADVVPNVPYTVLDNLAGQKLVLKVVLDGETHLIYCGNMPKTAPNRVYYTAADLVKLFAVK